MARTPFDRKVRIGTVAIVFGLGALGLACPQLIVIGGLAWLVFLLAVVAGWGSLVARLARIEEPDVGLRMVWGIAGLIAVTGPLIAFGICSRGVLLGLIGIGGAAFAWRELTAARRIFERGSLPLAVVVLIAGLLLVHAIGSVSAIDRNPWDDDLAYTPLIKRLLDAGDLLEPFSLRRLGAYGGQTVLGALAGARGTLVNVHLIDRGLCLVVFVLLIVGHARARNTSALWLSLLALVVLLMPKTSINTASYWSGAALVFGMYRTAVREQWGLAGLLGAATCTLRQNYIPICVLFLGAVLLRRLLASSWAKERLTWRAVISIAVVALMGWWIAAYASNRTFLFPLVGGTLTDGLTLKPTALTWLQELQFFMWCCIETGPIVIVAPLFVVLAVARDPRKGRPLSALFLAVTAGFVLLVHSFPGSEATHLWRYAFGPAMALLAALVLEAGAPESDGSVRLPALAHWLVVACLLLQLVANRGAVRTWFEDVGAQVREAREVDGTSTRYAALQAAIPAGEHVAVMLDEPGHLDFARNRIFNLDTPGYASPGKQLPSFQGAAAWRAYFREQGIRYVAFVRSSDSAYFFRREFWMWRIFNDSELFQAMSAYTIDAIDTFAELATTSTILHDKDGLVALDLGDRHPSEVPRDSRDEVTRRAQWVRALVEREHVHDAWSLNTRENVIIQDGFSNLTMVDEAAIDDPTWFDLTHRTVPDPEHGRPVRWLFRRAHVRVHGVRDMRLVLRGTVNMGAVHTRPRLDVSLEGVRLASVVVDERGLFTVEVVVPAAQLGGWRDLYLVWSSIAEPAKDARDLRIARLWNLEWEPVAP